MFFLQTMEVMNSRMLFLDLDGTLLNVAERYYSIHCLICGKLCLKPMDKAMYWLSKQKRVSEESILRDCGLEGIDASDLTRERVSMLESLEYLAQDSLHPGVESALSFLSSKNSLILVTLRKNRENLLRQLRLLKIDGYFENILNPDALHPTKAKELLVSDFCKSDLSTSLLFGDTEADLVAGKKLGCKTVAVTLGMRSKRFLESYNPDYFINSWNINSWANDFYDLLSFERT